MPARQPKLFTAKDLEGRGAGRHDVRYFACVDCGRSGAANYVPLVGYRCDECQAAATGELAVWANAPIDCDGCGNWISAGEKVEIVDDDDRYYFCEICATATREESR